MAGTPVNPSQPLSAQNAPVGSGIPAIAASHPGFIRESPSGELVPAGADDHKVDVTATDTTPGYLQHKLTAGSGVTLTLVNPGGDEQLQIAASAMASAEVGVTVADTTPGFLTSKIVVGAGLSLTTLNPGGNEQLRIDILTAFDITGFGLTGASLVLAGATVVTPGFAASYNQAATAVSLTDTEGNNDVIALPGTAFVSPHNFTKNVYGASVTFTLHGTGPTGTGSDTAAAGLVWGQNVFFGSAVDPGVYNSAFANSLGAALKLGPQGTYAYNTPVGQSSFFWTRTAFGLTPLNFFVGGFPFACSKVAAAVNVTNANGIVEQYDCFRSDNTGLGAFNLVEQ